MKEEPKYYNHLCACGCGGRIEVKEYHKYKSVGIPRFLTGHNKLRKYTKEEYIIYRKKYMKEYNKEYNKKTTEVRKYKKREKLLNFKKKCKSCNNSISFSQNEKGGNGYCQSCANKRKGRINGITLRNNIDYKYVTATFYQNGIKVRGLPNDIIIAGMELAKAKRKLKEIKKCLKQT